MVLLQNPSNGETQSSESDPAPLCSGDSAEDATDTHRFSEDLDSTCSTPYVSAPSSPGRGPTTTAYFFSAPASPMHFMMSSVASPSYSSSSNSVFPETTSFEFEFSSRFSPNGSITGGSMSSADELFLNGQIRPMKLSSHLQRPQFLAPLLDLDVEEDHESQMGKCEESVNRGRDLKLRSRSLHRKARSLSPLRNSDLMWLDNEDCKEAKAKETNKSILDLHHSEGKQSEAVSTETTPSCSASSSRSSSSGRNSKKWIFLKDLFPRSKSEGRGNTKEKFWSSISFSPYKEKQKSVSSHQVSSDFQNKQQKKKRKQTKQVSANKRITEKPVNGVAKRRVQKSAHELHYTTNRAQAEEMRKKTFLPYRQGLLGCLGFSSKGYGALNGLTRTLNVVSSR